MIVTGNFNINRQRDNGHDYIMSRSMGPGHNKDVISSFCVMYYTTLM